jgi:hypothetical protein
MEKEFIPYEQALALKELGFDEPCFFSYDYWNTEHLANSYYDYVNYNIREKIVSAPLYQQAFRWLYYKLNIENSTMPFNKKTQDVLLKELINKALYKHPFF